MRVFFGNGDDPLSARLPEAIYLTGRHQTLEKTAQDTEVILCADWRYQRSPVLVSRRVGDGRIACTTLPPRDDPALHQILYRVVRHLGGQAIGGLTLGVAIGGCSPSILEGAVGWPNLGHAKKPQRCTGRRLITPTGYGL